MEVLAVIYCILGFIAAGKTIFKNTAVVGFGMDGFINGHFQLFMFKVLAEIILGWILIPIWIIKSIRDR